MRYYSVYNPTRQKYEVYADYAGPTPRPQAPKGGPVIGIQDALPVVPATATLRGFSDYPVGTVSQVRSQHLAWGMLAVIVGLVYVIMTIKPED